MNIFSVLFWGVWFIYAASLFQQFVEGRRRKKRQKQEDAKLCNNCKHYKGCKDLHQLIDQGLPLPLFCEGFEHKDKEKCNTKPGRRRADRRRPAK